MTILKTTEDYNEGYVNALRDIQAWCEAGRLNNIGELQAALHAALKIHDLIQAKK